MSKKAITEKQITIRYLELSDELGYSQNTIHWVHHAVKILCKRKIKESTGEQIPIITAKELCTVLIKDINQLYDEPIENTLRTNKLFSSKNVGEIVYGLADKKLVTIGPDESVADFDNIFTVENIRTFLSEVGIRQRTFSFYRWYRKVMWALYIVGFAIVAASYTDIVSSHIGWVGWGIGMIGFSMQYIKLPSRKRF